MVIPYLLEDWQREADIVTMDEQNVVKAVGNYILKQTLGKGSMGKVKLGIHVVTGEKAAIKIVPRATRNRKLTPKELSRELRAVREGHLMMLLNHPHIVYLRDMVAGSHYYYFMMDYVSGGQLLHYIVKRNYLTEQHARHFCRQMVSALDYMHRNSVVHRDLKIENILVDSGGHSIKIIDFGLSNLFCPERQLTTYCGSLYFAAPELLNGRPYRGPEIDVWSLGVVLYVMVTGSVPFDDKSLPGLHEKIKRAQVAYPAHVSSQCHQLLSTIFVAEPQQRITLADIIRHPWLNYGHSSTICNHLPFREPLCLPLDENVLKRMTYGFNLGTTDDIRMKMEVILQSSVYRVSATHVSDIQSLTLDDHNAASNSNLSNNSFSSTTSLFGKSRNRLSGKKSGKRTNGNKETSHMIWGTYSDPQTVPAAYHPLLSIYYLTRERMERIDGNTSPGKKLSMKSVSPSSPPITKPVLLSLENTIDNLHPKHLASSQQSNHHYRHQSDSGDNDCCSTKRSLHTSKHHSQCNVPPMIPSAPLINTDQHKKLHHHHHQNHHYHCKSPSSFSSLARTSSLISLAPSTSSTHSYTCTASANECTFTSCTSSSMTLPASQHFEMTNNSNAKTKSTVLPRNVHSTRKPRKSKRKLHLLLKLGALFKRTQKKQSHCLHKRKTLHRHKNTNQQCEETLAAKKQCCLHHHHHPKPTDTRQPRGLEPAVLDSDRHQRQQPSTVSSTPIHQQNAHHIPLLTSTTSSDSRQTSQCDRKSSIDNENKQDTSSSTTEMKISDTTCRHECTPGWLSQRLSTWMDHALLLNRSTSGLGRNRRI